MSESAEGKVGELAEARRIHLYIDGCAVCAPSWTQNNVCAERVGLIRTAISTLTTQLAEAQAHRDADFTRWAEENRDLNNRAVIAESRLADAEAKSRIDEEQCDRMTAEAGRLAQKLAEVERERDEARARAGWLFNLMCDPCAMRAMREEESGIAEDIPDAESAEQLLSKILDWHDGSIEGRGLPAYLAAEVRARHA